MQQPKDLLSLFGPAWAVVLDAKGRVREIIPNPHARPKPTTTPYTEQMLSRIVFEPETG